MGCGPPTPGAPATNKFAPPPAPAPPRHGIAAATAEFFGRPIRAAAELRPDELKAILKRENDLRLCDETQRRFKLASVRPDGWLQVVEQLQRQVAAEFGLSEAVGLAAMRHATQLLPDDPEVIELSLYRKFNRCVDGNLDTGDCAPDAALLPLAAVRGAASGSSGDEEEEDEAGAGAAAAAVALEAAETTSLLALLRGDRAAWRRPGSPPLAAAAAASPVELQRRPLALLVGSYT